MILTESAQIIKAHPMTAGNTNSIIVFFRPTLSTKQPTAGAEASAPTAIMDPIQDMSSLLMGKPYSPLSRRSPAGEVQAKQVPLINPPMVADNTLCSLTMTSIIIIYFVCYVYLCISHVCMNLFYGSSIIVVKEAASYLLYSLCP